VVQTKNTFPFTTRSGVPMSVQRRILLNLMPDYFLTAGRRIGRTGLTPELRSLLPMSNDKILLVKTGKKTMIKQRSDLLINRKISDFYLCFHLLSISGNFLQKYFVITNMNQE
jgi:hypothetical protein